MMQFSSRELNQYTSKVQKHARSEPVLITNRGKPDQVLMSYADYETMINSKTEQKPFVSIADTLGYSDASDIDFEPPRVDIGFRDVAF